MLRKAAVLFIAAVLFFVMTGCDIQIGDRNTVTILISPWDSLTEKEFDRYIVQAVHQKYPEIQIKKLVKPITQETFNDFKTKGTTPDIIITASPFLQDLKPFGFLHNIEALLQQSGFDTSRLDPMALESVAIEGGDKYLTAVPFIRQFNALYFNKDIFDKFHVPYPQDGMTWQDAAQLAAKVTRLEGGVQYRGLEADKIVRPASALRPVYVDPRTKQSIVVNDTWKLVFETIKPIYDIPGNKEITELTDAFQQFFGEGRLAMLGGLNWLHSIEQMDVKFKWDLASYPVFKQAPGAGMQLDAHVMVITETSKNKDKAAKIVQTVLSDEVQLDVSKNGRVSVLADDKVKRAFGESMDLLKGKNAQAIYKTAPTKPIEPSPYNGPGGVIMAEAMRDAVLRGKTIDKVLQEANENMNLYLYMK
jgi:multiple sugar transport system substrate-binding protein